MHPAPLLFAAGFDWLEGLGGVAIFIIWVVFQIINAIRAGGQRQPAPPQAPPRPERRPPAPAAGNRRKPEPQAELERQIEDFLRGRGRGDRAAGDRRPPQPVVQPAPQPSAPPARPARARVEPPDLPRPQPSGPRGGRDAQAGTARDSPPRLAGGERDSGGIGRHVAAAFGHELDHLQAGLPGAEAGPQRRPEPPTVAAELAQALRSPTTLRQLILLREVLDRPTDRW